MVLEPSTKSRRWKVLEILPANLDELFQHITSRIRNYPTMNQAEAELGMQVLMWLHFANPPLKLLELEHALTVKKSNTEFHASHIPSLKLLLECCLGLVVVDEETSTVRFMHFTYLKALRTLPTPSKPVGNLNLSPTLSKPKQAGRSEPGRSFRASKVKSPSIILASWSRPAA